MSFRKTQRLGLVLIILGYITLGVTYALATPPLEASDEYKHYPFVQYVQTQHALPVLDPDDPGLWLQEAAQPPLYYLLMAALTAPIDTSDLPALHHQNPHAFIGNPGQVTNKNLIIHHPAREAFPWQGAVLAVYLIRLASIGLGVGTVLLAARLGSTLFNPQVGLLAAALTAFNPMFLFVSAAVNNDSLAILLGHLGLYLLVRLWQDAPDPRACWQRYAALGAVLGLGILTKLSLGGLLGLTVLALTWLAWRRRERRLLFGGGAIVVAAALAIPVWWFARNLRVYGNLTGLDAFIAVQGTRQVPITWTDWVGEFGTFYRSYWGLFGGVNVAAPEPFYFVCNLAALVGAAGAGLWLWRTFGIARGRGVGVPNGSTELAEVLLGDQGDTHQQVGDSRKRDGTWLLAAWAAVLLLLLLRWNIISAAFQGRLIFPALGALNVLWAVGLLAWTGDGRRPVLALAVAGWMLGAAMILPWATIRPAYAYPEPLTEVPEAARFGPITFSGTEGGEIQLVGVEMQSGQSVTPAGEPVEVVLYWQAVQPTERDYVSTVHLLGREYTSVGQVNRYPAWGMIPTSQWQANQIWRDVYHVFVDKDAAAPTRLRVSVGMYDAGAGHPLPATGPDGKPLELVLVGEARLTTDRPPPLEPPVTLEMNWAEGIALTGYSLDERTLNLTLYWRATNVPSEDYTVFVHLLDESGAPRGQGDGPPVGGDYPTSFWEAGEVIIDKHHVDVDADAPPGSYRLAVGLYRLADGTRLAVWDAAGTPQPDKRVILPVEIKLD